MHNSVFGSFAEIEALLDQTTFTLETVQRLEDRIEIISETQNAALARGNTNYTVLRNNYFFQCLTKQLEEKTEHSVFV